MNETKTSGPFGCKCTTLAHHVAGDGCSECNPKLHAEILADRLEELERELAAKDAHADEIYKAAVDLAAMLEGDLEQERALADRLAETLANIQGDYASNGALVIEEVDTALASWKQARGKEA